VTPSFSRIQSDELFTSKERSRSEFERRVVTAGNILVADLQDLPNQEHDEW
jgi:hypothetical protein